jgi:prophage antirepressor-like protein
MSNSLIAYHFHNSNVRVLNDQNEYLFCLSDVCKNLQLQNSRTVAKQIKEEFLGCNLKILPVMDRNRHVQNTTFITEPQLYYVIMRSRAKVAHKFRQWICNEVLPSIRKNGSYSNKNEFNAGYEVGIAIGQKQIKQEYENKLKDYKGNLNLSVTKDFKSDDNKFKFGIDKNSLVFEFLNLKKKIKANKEQWNKEVEQLQSLLVNVNQFVTDCIELDSLNIK